MAALQKQSVAIMNEPQAQPGWGETVMFFFRGAFCRLDQKLETNDFFMRFVCDRRDCNKTRERKRNQNNFDIIIRVSSLAVMWFLGWRSEEIHIV